MSYVMIATSTIKVQEWVSINLVILLKQISINLKTGAIKIRNIASSYIYQLNNKKLIMRV